MEYTYINEQDVNEVKKIQNRLNSTIDIIQSSINYLSKLVADYKDLVDQAINSNLDYANITGKYQNSSSTGAYNFPGVFASTLGNYSIDEAREDNESLKDAIEKRDSIDKRKEIDFKMIVQTYSDIKTKFNLMASDNQQIFNYLNNLCTE